MKQTSSSAVSFRRDAARSLAIATMPWLAPDDVSRSQPEHPANLTPRQLEVLALLCEGLSNKLICRRLNIATGTVKVHISSILRELGVTSRLQAVLAAPRYRAVEGAAASMNGQAGSCSGNPDDPKELPKSPASLAERVASKLV